MREGAGVLKVAGACELPVSTHLRLQLCLILLNELIAVSLRCELLFRALDCGQVLVGSPIGWHWASCGRLIWRFVGWLSLISLMSLVNRWYSVGFNPLHRSIFVQTIYFFIFLFWAGWSWGLGESWAASWLVAAQASGSLLQHHFLFNRIFPHSHRGVGYLGWYLTQKCMHILRRRCFLMLHGDKRFISPLTPLCWHLFLLSWHECRDLIKVICHLLAEMLLLLAGVNWLEATRLTIGEIARKLGRASYLEGWRVERLAVWASLG